MTRDNGREARKPAETQREGSGAIKTEVLIPQDHEPGEIDKMLREYFGSMPKHPLTRE